MPSSGSTPSPRALLDPRAWLAILRAVGFVLGGLLAGTVRLPPARPLGGRLGLPADFLIAPDGPGPRRPRRRLQVRRACRRSLVGRRGPGPGPGVARSPGRIASCSPAGIGRGLTALLSNEPYPGAHASFGQKNFLVLYGTQKVERQAPAKGQMPKRPIERPCPFPTSDWSCTATRWQQGPQRRHGTDAGTSRIRPGRCIICGRGCRSREASRRLAFLRHAAARSPTFHHQCLPAGPKDAGKLPDKASESPQNSGRSKRPSPPAKKSRAVRSAKTLKGPGLARTPSVEPASIYSVRNTTDDRLKQKARFGIFSP